MPGQGLARKTTPELGSRAAGVLLAIVHLAADSFSFKAQVGDEYTVGARDEGRVRTGVAGRLHRAVRNYTENLVLFAAAVFILHAAGISGPLTRWGGYLWVGGRVLYLPASYGSGIPWSRTICWQVSMIGLVMMLAARVW